MAVNITPEIAKRLESSLVDFRHVVLVNDPDKECAPAPYHHELSDLLLHGKSHMAIEMFRESAKSAYALRSFPLHCLAYPHKDRTYIVIIKQNKTLASDKLSELIAEYKSNPALRHNLVGIVEENKNAFSVDVKNREGEIINVRIQAFGKGSAIRGLNHMDRRPDVIILDDIQDSEDVRGIAVENDWNWFLSDVKFLGKNSRIFLIGNNLGENCVIERVITKAEHLGFEAMRIPAMQDGVSTWPSKNTVEEIEKQKADYAALGKLDIFYSEMMCVAVSEETRIFNEKDYRYYSPSRVDELAGVCNVYAVLDPASSTKGTSCLRAVDIVGVDSNNNWFILDVRYGRWDSAQMMDVIFEVVKKWNLRDFHIEKGHYQQVIGPFLTKEMKKRNVFFNVEPLEHGKVGTKLERIKMLQPRFKAHSIYFPDEAEWLPELKSELAGVTKDAIKSQYIDVVDALAMVEQIAEAPHNITQINFEAYSNGSLSAYPEVNLFG